MGNNHFPTIHSIVVYSPYLWPHAVAALRAVRPIQQAGLQYIPGKEAENIYIQRVSEADIVLIQREFPLYWEQYEQILSLARSQGTPVVYEIDDLLLEIPDIHPDQAIDFYTPAIFPILHALASADLVTTTSPNLVKYLQRFNPNIFLLPNYLDSEYWKMRPYRANPVQSPVVIGYMGSDTHLPDLESILPVFIHLANRFGDRVRFRFWGCKPPEMIQQLSQTEWLPLQIFDYPKFAEHFTRQDVDILIAPLLDSLFNRCKSTIKLLEYSSLGVPIVSSRIAPYESIIVHGENGLIASTLEEWESNLTQLIIDPELREQIGRRLQETVSENWLLSLHAQEWVEAYQHAQVLARRGDNNQRAEQSRFLQNASRQTLMMHRRQNLRIAQMETKVQNLQQQLDEIYGSQAWSLIQWLRRLRLAIIPTGSAREKYFKRVIQGQKSAKT